MSQSALHAEFYPHEGLQNQVFFALGSQGSFTSSPMIYFHTGSHEKLEQYQYLFGTYGIGARVSRLSLVPSEPQVEGTGPGRELSLVEEPLKFLSRFAEAVKCYPLVVEDTMLFIEHFNRDFNEHALLPGPDTKRWWHALEAEGLLALLRESNRRRARYVCQLGILFSKGQYRFFRAELEGAISHAVRSTAEAQANFPYTNAKFFHTIFIPDGSQRTLGEMGAEEFGRFDYRRRCVNQAASMVLDYYRDAQNTSAQVAWA